MDAVGNTPFAMCTLNTLRPVERWMSTSKGNGNGTFGWFPKKCNFQSFDWSVQICYPVYAMEIANNAKTVANSKLPLVAAGSPPMGTKLSRRFQMHPRTEIKVGNQTDCAECVQSGECQDGNGTIVWQSVHVQWAHNRVVLRASVLSGQGRY